MKNVLGGSGVYICVDGNGQAIRVVSEDPCNAGGISWCRCVDISGQDVC